MGETATAMELADSLSDKEVIEEFARAYDLDPDDVVMMGEEGIEMAGDLLILNWAGYSRRPDLYVQWIFAGRGR